MILSDATDPAELAAELAGLLRPGISAKRLASCPRVLSLALVQAKSASDQPIDRAVAAYGLLGELVISADGERNGPIASLLALADGTRGSLLKERRHHTAALLYISPAHLRTSRREEALIEALADELYAADSAYRLRHRHRMNAEREPGDSRLGIDWLDRHQAYRRVWTPVAALRNDLAALLELLRDDADHNDIIDRLTTMAWRYAQFTTELERFTVDYGGLWLLSDIDSELALAAAVRTLYAGVPFGDADDSWLRLTLKRSEGGELEPFNERLLKDETGQLLLGAWLAWARECQCSMTRQPQGKCAVHAWVGAADHFGRLIDADWLAVADWYRLPSDRSHIDPSGSNATVAHPPE